MKETPVPIRAENYSGFRFYTPLEGGTSKPSSTSVEQIIPKPHLIKWKMEKGQEASDAIMYSSALIGDIVHAGCDILVKHGSLSMGEIYQMIRTHEKINEVLTRYSQYTGYSHIDFIYRAVSRRLEGFERFWDEKNPSVLASELSMYHEDLPWAGTADLTALYKPRINSKSPIICMIDYKTGSQQRFEHTLQLVSYALLWNKHFPDEEVTHVGNLYLSDSWRKTPKYKLTVTAMTDELIDQWWAVMNCWTAIYGDMQPVEPEPVKENFKISINNIKEKENG